MRRVTAHEATYTGPLRSLLSWAAAVARSWLSAQNAAQSPGATPQRPPASADSPTPTRAAGATRLRLPVTLRGLCITVQPRCGAEHAAVTGGVTPTQQTPALTPQRQLGRADSMPVTPASATPARRGGLQRAASLTAHRRLLSSGRWRLMSRLARLFDVTLVDVLVDVLPPEEAAGAAHCADGGRGVSLRLERVAICALPPGADGTLRVSAHASGASMRVGRGGMEDAAASPRDGAGKRACVDDDTVAAATSSPAPACDAIASLSYVEVVADLENDPIAGMTRCARLEVDAGAVSAALNAASAAALRCVSALWHRAELRMLTQSLLCTQGVRQSARGRAAAAAGDAGAAARSVAPAPQLSRACRVSRPRARRWRSRERRRARPSDWPAVFGVRCA